MAEAEKRYVVSVDMYVYAKDDYMARKRAHKMVDYIDEEYVNARPAITELGSQPFASMSYRKLDDHSKPRDKSVDKPLPF
tara:strand:- start:756 stop:995 length:240 start_codon:yes stop_codon:yes gene_type:complete